MTAPDRGATYQIALASTGSSTHERLVPAQGVGSGVGSRHSFRRYWLAEERQKPPHALNIQGVGNLPRSSVGAAPDRMAY